MNSKTPKHQHYRCCVRNCKNSSSKSPHLKFYSFPSGNILFPHRTQRREAWLNAVKLTNPDGSPFVPKRRSRICSAHFVGNKKVEDPRSPSYNPTIFPDIPISDEFNPQTAKNWYKRKLKPEKAQIKVPEEKSKQIKIGQIIVIKHSGVSQNTVNDKGYIQEAVQKKDQETQVDFLDTAENLQSIFICNRHLGSTCDAETQVYGPSTNTKIKSANTHEDKKLKKKEVPIPKREEKNSGFVGFSCITCEQEMIDLAGVSLNAFNLLLIILRKAENKTDDKNIISDENKLLIFLIKMKCGLTFTVISVLFSIDKNIVENIFYFTLGTLSSACKNFIFWPHKELVQKTMPSVFKPEYSSSRVIIDLIEFDVEQPPTTEQKVQMYSHRKNGYALKVAIGYSPCGFISFVSKCHGGQLTDDQIISSSELLNLLDPGDLVLANRDFPKIKKMLHEKGQNILLALPVLTNENFIEEDAEDTITKVRFHIDKIMQRMRSYKITDKFTISMLPYSDNIIFMCSVLANLKATIIQDKT